jgi:hypothetical protein
MATHALDVIDYLFGGITEVHAWPAQFWRPLRRGGHGSGGDALPKAAFWSPGHGAMRPATTTMSC